MMMNSLFYELLQMALGKRKTLSCTPCPEEWNSIFLMAQEQAVTGVAFLALDLIRNEQKPQQTLLYEWIGVSEQIKQRNLVVNNYCLELTRHFENAGFRCCILKGQGNAQMYFEPLSRIPGDIDIWLDADKEKIVSFIRKRFPDTNDSGMHLNYPILKDVEVEVHYRPQYLSCKKYDKRLQRYFSSISDVQFEHKVRLEGADGDICTPDLEFNLVLQFAHLLGHFYGDGIGLRHFVDLYYLLLQIEHSIIMVVMQMGEEESTDLQFIDCCSNLFGYILQADIQITIMSDPSSGVWQSFERGAINHPQDVALFT